MLSNFFNGISQLLRGKNGNVYFAVMSVLFVVFLLKILPKVIWFGVMSVIVYFIFKMFEKKHA